MNYIIGFGYKKGVGKSTSAEYVHGKLIRGTSSFKRFTFILSFGNAIKNIAKSFNWNGEKDERGRRLLQEIGDVGRHYNQDIWIDFVLGVIQRQEDFRRRWSNNKWSSVYLIDDIRFEDEAQALRSLSMVDKTILIRLDRETGFEDGHKSEHGLDNFEDWDLIIDNNGTPEELYEKLDDLINSLKEVK